MIQFIFSGLLALMGGVISWFITKIFKELEVGRSNDRELYANISKTREDMLKESNKSLERENALLKVIFTQKK